MKRAILMLALVATLMLVAACAAPAVQVVERVVTATPPPAVASAATAPVPGKPGEAKTYRVGIFSDLKTMNWWNHKGPATVTWQRYVLSPLHISLYTYAEQTWQVIPQVAVDLNAHHVKEGDRWTITAKLKKGIKWSNGKEVTATDVAFPANTALELELVGTIAVTYDKAYLEKVEVVDDYTAKFIWKKEPGLAKWEYGAAQAALMNAEYWAPVVDKAKKVLAAADKNNKEAYAKALSEAQQVLYNHVPTDEPLAGPFLFSKWEKGAYFETKANPDYFLKGTLTTVYENGYAESKGGVSYKQGDTSKKLFEFTRGPNVSGVVYTLYTTMDAAVLALKKGEVDMLLNPNGLPVGLVDQVRGQKDISISNSPNNGLRYMGFNVLKKPMSDIEFRTAMAYLIDKEFVAKSILQGVVYPMYGEVPDANTFWSNPNIPKIGKEMPRDQRLAKAVELLKKAGYKWEGGKEPTWDQAGVRVVPGGKLLNPDGTPMRALSLIGPSAGYDPLRSTFAIWIERFANEVGIQVKAELIGFNDLTARVMQDPDRGKNLDLWVLAWGYTEPFPTLMNNWHNSRFVRPGDYNAGGYSNPEFDKLGDSLFDCKTLEDCRTIAFKMQEMLATELPYVVLFDAYLVEAYRSNVQFPFTETLSGLQMVHGLPESVIIQ